MVRVAGVGIPPGLIGIPFMQVVLPLTSISASAAGVNMVSSGVSPASETPRIVDVRVFATVHVKTPLFPQILDTMSFAIFSFPYTLNDGGSSNPSISSPFVLQEGGQYPVQGHELVTLESRVYTGPHGDIH